MSESLFFSCTLLKLVCLITQLTCSGLYLIITGLLAYAQAVTRASCIANVLRILKARYVITRVRRMHYLSSSNSPVQLGLKTTLARVGRLYY